jgi:TldD protein
VEDYAEAAVEAALAAGAAYADARVVVGREEILKAHNGAIEQLDISESAGASPSRSLVA